MARSAALLLSHGGFHTVARGLLAGVPQLIIASDREQRFNAQAVERLGAGIGLTRDSASVPAILDAVARALEDPSYAARARALAPEFRRRRAACEPIEVIADRIAALMPA